MEKDAERILIELDGEPASAHKEFLEALLEEDLDGKMCFEKLEGAKRTKEEDMELEEYFEYREDSIISSLDIRIEGRVPAEDPYISFMDSSKDFPDSIERFIKYNCPYNEENLEIVDSLFEKSYGSSIENYPDKTIYIAR